MNHKICKHNSKVSLKSSNLYKKSMKKALPLYRLSFKLKLTRLKQKILNLLFKSKRVRFQLKMTLNSKSAHYNKWSKTTKNNLLINKSQPKTCSNKLINTLSKKPSIPRLLQNFNNQLRKNKRIQKKKLKKRQHSFKSNTKRLAMR